MHIHQSDITQWARCPQAMFLDRAGNPGLQTSALSYGTVMHYALEAFEREYRTGTRSWTTALLIATETFKHYWHPVHIADVCQPVELWLPHQSYGGLLHNGVKAIQWYAETVRDLDEELLATEYAFSVPIEGTWDYDLDEPHILDGTIDRLSSRYVRRRLVLDVSDLKTGKDYLHLRQNVQFSAYCYATTRREFWTGNNGEDGFGPERGEALYQRFRTSARHATWIGLKNHKWQDAGWRGPDDYRRFALAVEQVVASIKADIYPLNLSGENCAYCTHRHICAGTGVPANNHGAPD